MAKELIRREFHRLGQDIMVRSSATVEDLKENAAAGQAESIPHVTNIDDVIKGVKVVWASLFSDGFVSDRNRGNISHLSSFMPVLLQKFINGKAAGVVTSVHPATARPVYNITAQPGLGEALVQGKGLVDKWLVGYFTNVILERQISEKRYRTIIGETGVRQDTSSVINEPCLSDNEVLRLARIIRNIHQYYSDNNLARNIDVEFVVDKNGDVYIVQTRAEALDQIKQNEDKFIFRIAVVDEDKLTPDNNFIQLSDKALAACSGTVVAELQIVPDNYGYRQAKAGTIVVTPHTNNEWNDVFGKLTGVITTDGGDTSHAAKNSRRLNIPSLVGSSGALEQLKPYNGKVVTFDSTNKRVYLGRVDIKQIEIPLEIWVSDKKEMESVIGNREKHELFKPWESNHADRAAVFVEFFDGHWRGRSNTYPYFQLDFYYQAWDRLTRMLNERFKDRRPFELKAQERLIRRKRLLHKIIPDNSGSIYDFLTNLKDVSIDYFCSLFNARWQGYRDFAVFMDTIEHIDASNVEPAVDQLIGIFVWMHFAYWLNGSVNINYVFNQQDYINRGFHEMFREMAIAELPEDKKVDLSRQKDKEFFAVLERIRSNPSLINIFEKEETDDFSGVLASQYPDIFAIIDGWSMKYKKGREHFDVLSDTEEYLRDVQDRLKKAIMPPLELVISIYKEYLDKNRITGFDINRIKETDDELYMFLRGYARLLFIRDRGMVWDKLTDKDKIVALHAVTAQEADESLIKLASEVEGVLAGRKNLEFVVSKMLKEFPDLKKTISLSKQETTLREDGHHLIVPQQRRFARMMLDVGRQYLSILGTPEKIFEISTDEFIALLQETDSSYIKSTFQRCKIVEEAETMLIRGWDINREQTVNNYSKSIDTAIAILDEQLSQAKISRVKGYYESEKIRLREEVKKVRILTGIFKFMPLLNANDVSKDNLNADVLFICGNDCLETFSEAINLYKEGKIRKILISGGYGRLTLPLIKAIKGRFFYRD